jgi:transposase-like protein
MCEKQMHAAASIFYDEGEAYRYVERYAWPEGPYCPHCNSRRVGKLTGASTRMGTYKCYVCRKPFTVKIGTVFERSHLPLHIWLKAIFLVSTSKKQINARELENLLEITPKTANSMIERLEPLYASLPFE